MMIGLVTGGVGVGVFGAGAGPGSGVGPVPGAGPVGGVTTTGTTGGAGHAASAVYVLVPDGASVQPDWLPAYALPTVVPVSGSSIAEPLLVTVTTLPWTLPDTWLPFAAAQFDCSLSRVPICAIVSCSIGALLAKYWPYWVSSGLTVS